jgi:hypothetical protein
MRVAPFLVLALLLAAPPAMADTGISLSVSSDPTIGKAMTFTATGTTPPPCSEDDPFWSVDTIVRPASDGPCGRTVGDDPSLSRNDSIADSSVQPMGNSAFTLPSKLAADESVSDKPGGYLYCGWIGNPTAGTAAATASLPVTIRKPRLTLKISVPKGARLRGKGTVTIKGTVEVGASINVIVLPRRLKKCAATPDAEDTALNGAGLGLVTDDLRAGRSYRYRRKLVFDPPGWDTGSHLVCGWLSYGDGPAADGYLAGKSNIKLKR